MSATSPNTEAELRSIKVEITDLQTKLCSMESTMSSIHAMLISQSQTVPTPSAVANSPLHEGTAQLGDPIKGDSTLSQTQQLIRIKLFTLANKQLCICPSNELNAG